MPSAAQSSKSPHAEVIEQFSSAIHNPYMDPVKQMGKPFNPAYQINGLTNLMQWVACLISLKNCQTFVSGYGTVFSMAEKVSQVFALNPTNDSVELVLPPSLEWFGQIHWDKCICYPNKVIFHCIAEGESIFLDFYISKPISELILKLKVISFTTTNERLNDYVVCDNVTVYASDEIDIFGGK